MKNYRLEIGFIAILLFALPSCGPTQKELEENAKLACLRIGETRNMDGELRVRIISEFGIKADRISFVKTLIEYGLILRNFRPPAETLSSCVEDLLAFHPDSKTR